MTDGYENALLQWQQQQQRHLQSAENAATLVAKTLKARGVTFVEFEYYGSGDSGCIENCHIEGSGTMSQEEQEKLENLVYDLLPVGWEINEGSQGTITFDLETGSVSVDHKWLEYVDADVPGLKLDLDEIEE